MSVTRRRGAYASGMLTFAVFLIPALFAPGPIEIANVAGVALAVWLAVDAWRIFGRRDLKATLPYRVAPVAPGLLGSAALIFMTALIFSWFTWQNQTHAQLNQILTFCAGIWNFPFSPIAMLARPASGLPTISAETVQSITLCLTAAVVLGLAFGLFSLFGRIDELVSLRRHALVWRGQKAPDGVNRLEARGARGLKPVRSADYGVTGEKVSGRLMVRALSMIVAIFFLPFAPLFMRFIAGSGFPQAKAFFASPLIDSTFFNVWIVGLWATLIAAAIILFFAYIRLSVVLRIK